MSKSKVEHTTIRNGNLFCLNCGGIYILNMPIGINEMTKKIDAFNVLHKDCIKTWTEPVNDTENKSMEENMQWWILNGEHGTSSKNMYEVLGSTKNYSGSLLTHPLDPSDFRRCSKLLKAVPQFRGKLHKLKTVSNTWSNLVDNWDALEKMIEEAQSLYKKGSAHSILGEMYDFMQKLGC